MSDDLSNKKVTELRAKAKELGLPTYGTKAKIIERIQEHCSSNLAGKATTEEAKISREYVELPRTNLIPLDKGDEVRIWREVLDQVGIATNEPLCPDPRKFDEALVESTNKLRKKFNLKEWTEQDYKEELSYIVDPELWRLAESIYNESLS